MHVVVCDMDGIVKRLLIVSVHPLRAQRMLDRLFGRLHRRSLWENGSRSLTTYMKK